MMVKQIRLAFLEENGLETLWEQFPERERDEVTHIEAWRHHYNHERPHRSLGKKLPAVFAEEAA